jgi:hypothetical protein
MDANEPAQSGRRLHSEKKRRVIGLPRRLLLLLPLSLLLSGCFATTRATGPTGPTKKLTGEARCAGWTDLSYIQPGDTAQTIDGIRKHNEVYDRKGCPRKVRR